MQRILAFWPLGLVPFVVVVVLSALFGSIRDLKITKAQHDLKTIDTALHIYKSKHGDFPSELTALTGEGEPLLHLAKDPWGNAYLYRRVGSTDAYLLYSPGVDHRDDAGLGDDVILGPKTYGCSDYGVNCSPTAGQVGAWSALVLAAFSLAVGILRAGLRLPWLVRRPNNRWRGP